MITRSQQVTTLSGTVSNTALTLVTFGFDVTVVQGADRVIISVTAGALRVTWDSALAVPPTTTTGQRIPTSNYPLFVLEGRINAGNFRIIRDAAADATVTITIETE